MKTKVVEGQENAIVAEPSIEEVIVLTEAEIKLAEAEKLVKDLKRAVREQKSNKPDRLTRLEVIGQVMRENPTMPTKELETMTDKLYAEKSGRPLNQRESEYWVSNCVKFLKGYAPTTK